MKESHRNREKIPYDADDLAVYMYDYINSGEFAEDLDQESEYEINEPVVSQPVGF